MDLVLCLWLNPTSATRQRIPSYSQGACPSIFDISQATIHLFATPAPNSIQSFVHFYRFVPPSCPRYSVLFDQMSRYFLRQTNLIELSSTVRSFSHTLFRRLGQPR